MERVENVERKKDAEQGVNTASRRSRRLNLTARAFEQAADTQRRSERRQISELRDIEQDQDTANRRERRLMLFSVRMSKQPTLDVVLIDDKMAKCEL